MRVFANSNAPRRSKAWREVLLTGALLLFAPASARSEAAAAGRAQTNEKAAARGAELFESKGCIGCHAIGGTGGSLGPALDSVGMRLRSDYLDKWLRNPSDVKPGTNMPTLDLSDAERAALVAFLERLKTDEDGRPQSPAPHWGEGWRSRWDDGSEHWREGDCYHQRSGCW